MLEGTGTKRLALLSEVVRHTARVFGSSACAASWGLGNGNGRGQQMRSCMHTTFPWDSKQIVNAWSCSRLNLLPALSWCSPVVTLLIWPLSVVSFCLAAAAV